MDYEEPATVLDQLRRSYASLAAWMHATTDRWIRAGFQTRHDWSSRAGRPSIHAILSRLAPDDDLCKLASTPRGV